MGYIWRGCGKFYYSFDESLLASWPPKMGMGRLIMKGAL